LTKEDGGVGSSKEWNSWVGCSDCRKLSLAKTRSDDSLNVGSAAALTASLPFARASFSCKSSHVVSAEIHSQAFGFKSPL
jgi:hypothetical protein